MTSPRSRPSPARAKALGSASGRPRAAGLRALACSLLLGGALFGGCGEEPISVQLRSLERSGQMSFVCLGAPGSPPLPLSACTSPEAESVDDFSVPHLYALVTQITRGEVAVIDLTTLSEPVLDQDDRVPGANFLPVGAQPIDIVSSPGGTASFVSVAEIGREGIFALPSSRIRPSGDPPTLTSWASCALPSAPGEMMLIADPWVDGEERATCDGTYGPVTPGVSGADLSAEGAGRYKLVATLPDEGGVVVVDAQSLLDREPGTFTPCDIERWVPFEVDLPPPAEPPPPPPRVPGCVDPAGLEPAPQGVFTSRPSGLALSESTLYVGDLGAPVIHVLDVETPCEPTQRPPLLPSSAEDPSRVVTTHHLAASPRGGPDFKRYLYAVDVAEGSAMVFDVSDDAASRSPLRRPDTDKNPFQPIDRIRYAATIRDIAIVTRDEPAEHPATGVAPAGTRCDPDPSLERCDVTSTTCDPETLYYTSNEFETGAGPALLRGSFAFLLLSSGIIVVIDIDDYDAACRAPESSGSLDPLFGCPGVFGPEATSDGATGEVSCNVVTPHEGRSARFVLSDQDVGRYQPGLVTYPLLYDADGGLIPNNVSGQLFTSPQMRGTRPLKEPGETPPLTLQVGGSDPVPVLGFGDDYPPDGIVIDGDTIKHTLLMNLENPRAHIADQDWTVTYEGPLPGFAGRRADLRMNGAEDQGLYDSASRFCDNGVLGLEAWRAMLEPLVGSGFTQEEVDFVVPILADRVQVLQPLPDEDDFYWDGASCTFQQCRSAFGTAEAPTLGRDIPILEAYQDHVLLADAIGVAPGLAECCFPTLVGFTVRPGRQWVVEGSASGFLHHVIPDPATGVCRNSCDPTRARLNGRVLSTASVSGVDQSVFDGTFTAFVNPMFRFAITESPDAPARRGHQFRFTTQGGFSTLVISLVTETLDVQPQSMSFLPSTGEIFVADGSLEGLLVVGTDSLLLERQYQ